MPFLHSEYAMQGINLSYNPCQTDDDVVKNWDTQPVRTV